MQFRAAGSALDDAEMKHQAVSLILTVPIWGSIVHLLGFEQNGQIVGQQLADELYGHKVTHVASPATALHQTFQGSGFV